MIVVADSGPLHYLILLDRAHLLLRLYGEVVVPEEVVRELRADGAPLLVREWMSAPPPWLAIVAVTDEDVLRVTDELDPGERAAIALAESMHADLLLIDEAAGRAEARRRNLRVTGTLGILRTAADARLIDAKDALDRLRSTNFYVDDELLKKVFGIGMP